MLPCWGISLATLVEPRTPQPCTIAVDRGRCAWRTATTVHGRETSPPGVTTCASDADACVRRRRAGLPLSRVTTSPASLGQPIAPRSRKAVGRCAPGGPRSPRRLAGAGRRSLPRCIRPGRWLPRAERCRRLVGTPHWQRVFGFLELIAACHLLPQGGACSAEVGRWGEFQGLCVGHWRPFRESHRGMQRS